MCTTYMAVASGFMISAAGNRDKTPWDRPVLRGREGVFLGLSGLVAVILGPKVMAGRAPVTRITDPRSQVQYDVGGGRVAWSELKHLPGEIPYQSQPAFTHTQYGRAQTQPSEPTFQPQVSSSGRSSWLLGPEYELGKWVSALK